MLRSMTGFGRGVLETPLGRFSVEIQSLNRKHLEVSSQLPKEFQRFEIELRKWVSQIISRGQIQIKVSVYYHGKSPLRIQPNLALARELKAAWDEIADELHFPKSEGFELNYLLPEADDLLLHEEDWTDEESYKEQLRKAFDIAFTDLMQMKTVEGALLQQDIEQRIENLHNLIKKVEVQAPEAGNKQKLKLQQKLMEWLPSTEENEDRILREIVTYADKADISEEITRFKAHLHQCKKILSGNETAIGKTFEFLLQELQREANTISSKSGDVTISHAVVEIKSELEKMREQIQNVE